MAESQSDLEFDLGEIGELEGDLSELEGQGESENGGASRYANLLVDRILGHSGEAESPLSEAEAASLAAELLEVESDEELEQFLGALIGRAVRSVRNFARSQTGRALGGILKGVAKKALPVVGGAIGSYLAPGIGTAIGSRLGAAASNLFELELETMEAGEAEFEVANRLVCLGAEAARNAARARPPEGTSPLTVARAAVARAAGEYAPGLQEHMVRSLRATAGTRRALPAPSGQPGRGRPDRRHHHHHRHGILAGWDPGVDVLVDAEPAPNGDSAGSDADANADSGAASGRWVRRGRKIVLIGI